MPSDVYLSWLSRKKRGLTMPPNIVGNCINYARVVAFPGHHGTGYKPVPPAYAGHEHTAPNHIPRCFRGGLGRPPRGNEKIHFPAVRKNTWLASKPCHPVPILLVPGLPCCSQFPLYRFPVPVVPVLPCCPRFPFYRFPVPVSPPVPVLVRFPRPFVAFSLLRC